MNERQRLLHRLRTKVADLEYRVASFGSLGDQRELDALRRELADLEGKPAPSHRLLALIA